MFLYVSDWDRTAAISPARFHYKWCQRLNLEDVGGQGHGTYLDYRRKYF